MSDAKMDEIRKRYPAGPEGLAKVEEALEIIYRLPIQLGLGIEAEFGAAARDAWSDAPKEREAAAIHGALWPPAPVDWATCGIETLIEGAIGRLQMSPYFPVGIPSCDKLAILADRLEGRMKIALSVSHPPDRAMTMAYLHSLNKSFPGQTPGEARLRALMAAGEAGA